MYKLPLVRVSALSATMPEGIVAERVTPANVHKISPWKGASYVRKFRRYLNRGDVGIYLFKDNQVVSYYWAKITQGVPAFFSHDMIDSGEVLLHRLEVNPNFRGLGFGTYTTYRLLQLIYDESEHKKDKQICVSVMRDNYTNQHILTKFGFTKVKHVFLVVLCSSLVFANERYLTGASGIKIRFRIPESFWAPAFNSIRSCFVFMDKGVWI